jgi:uncharacterized FlgJ-related protein
MTQEKKPPLGADIIKSYYQTVKEGCTTWETLLKQHQENVEALRESHQLLLVAILEENTEIAQRHLEECREQVATYKAQLYDMIQEWEEYWEQPFPYPEIKAEAEKWAYEEEQEESSEP